MLCSTSDESDTKWTIIIKHNMHNSEIRVLLLTRNMLSKDCPKFHFIWELDQCEDVMEGTSHGSCGWKHYI